MDFGSASKMRSGYERASMPASKMPAPTSSASVRIARPWTGYARSSWRSTEKKQTGGSKSQSTNWRRCGTAEDGLKTAAREQIEIASFCGLFANQEQAMSIDSVRARVSEIQARIA